MTFSRLHISASLALAVVLWALVLLIRGTPISVQHLTPFGVVVGLLVLFGACFNRMLWRHPWLHGWFVKRPDLRGTWRVELRSDWVDPDTGGPAPPITCYTGVEQTLSTLHMHLMTTESESWLIAHEIRPSPNDTGYQLVAVYTNKPEMNLRGDRSEIHTGALVLDTHGPSKGRPDTMTGEYWTDRKTAGQMTLSHRIPDILTRFEDAEERFR